MFGRGDVGRLRGPAAQERELEHLVEPYAQHLDAAQEQGLSCRLGGRFRLLPTVVDFLGVGDQTRRGVGTVLLLQLEPTYNHNSEMSSRTPEPLLGLDVV